MCVGSQTKNFVLEKRRTLFFITIFVLKNKHNRRCPRCDYRLLCSVSLGPRQTTWAWPYQSLTPTVTIERFGSAGYRRPTNCEHRKLVMHFVRFVNIRYGSPTPFYCKRWCGHVNYANRYWPETFLIRNLCT